jgi:hypothetical protein
MTEQSANRLGQLRSFFEQAANQGQPTVYTSAAPAPAAKKPALPAGNPKHTGFPKAPMAKGPKGPKGPMKGPAKMGKGPGPGPGAGKMRPLPLPKPKGFGQGHPNGVKPNPVQVNGNSENGVIHPGPVPVINTPNPAIVTNGPRVSPRGSVSPREQSPRESGAPQTIPQVNVQDPSGGSRPITIAATNALQVATPAIATNGTNVSPGTTPPTESADDFKKRDASRLTQMLSGETTYMQAWPTSPNPASDPADVVITRRPSQIDRPDSFYMPALGNDELFPIIDIPINSMRDNNAKEICTSEQSYLKSMMIMVELFQKPICEKSLSGELPFTPEEINTMFAGVTNIIAINTELLKGLVLRLKNWSDTQKLGDLILNMAPWLKMYTQYTANYERVLKILEEHKDEAVLNFFKTTHLHPLCKNLDFRAFLIMPIQRIPRYRLLLMELVKHTPDTHVDFKDLTESLEKVKRVADEIDLAVLGFKQREAMLRLQKKFDIQIIEPGRVLIREGVLTKLCRKDRQKRHFFLFNDVLIYADWGSTGKYTKERSFVLTQTFVKDLPDDVSRNMVNALQISTESKSFVVFTETPQEKAEWMKDVNAAIDKLDKSYKTLKAKKKQRDSVGMLAPVWVPDNESKSCTICAVKFTVTNRRHHCRQCGRVICGKCSSHKKDLPGQGRQRVCDDCHKRPVTTVIGTPVPAVKVPVDEASSEEPSETSSFSSSLNSSQQTDPVAINNAQNLVQEFAGRTPSPRNSTLSSSPGTFAAVQTQPTDTVSGSPQPYPVVQPNGEQYAEDSTPNGEYVAPPTEDHTQYDTTPAELQVQAQEEPTDTSNQTGYDENAGTEYAEEATDPNQDYVLIENQDPVCQVVANFDFVPDENDDESMRRLGFKAGQVIDVLQQDDSGWWLAKIDGVVGWIPESYCSLVQ